MFCVIWWIVSCRGEGDDPRIHTKRHESTFACFGCAHVALTYLPIGNLFNTSGSYNGTKISVSRLIRFVRDVILFQTFLNPERLTIFEVAVLEKAIRHAYPSLVRIDDVTHRRTMMNTRPETTQTRHDFVFVFQQPQPSWPSNSQIPQCLV